MIKHTMKSPAWFLTGTLRATFAASLLTFAVGAQSVKAADGSASVTESIEGKLTNGRSISETAAPQSTKTSPKKSDHERRMELVGISLGCVTSVTGLGIAFFAIWVDYRKRRELIANCHQERMAALEKGLDLPPFPTELWRSDTAPKSSGTGLKTGLMWFATGIGLWLFLSPKNIGFFHPSVGAIPGAIGVAYLVYYLLEGRKRSPGKDTTAP